MKLFWLNALKWFCLRKLLEWLLELLLSREETGPPLTERERTRFAAVLQLFDEIWDVNADGFGVWPKES